MLDVGASARRIAMAALSQPGFSRRLFNALGPFLGLVLVIGLFCLSSTVRPYFFTGANFKIIFTQTVIVAIGALGMTIIIVSGGIDLSMGSIVALTSVVGATALVKGHSVITAAVLTITVGAGIGLLNGLAIGGLMQLSRLTQGDPTVAVGLELDIIAAVVIDAASLSGGTGSILGWMIGALIMAVLRNGSSQMGWPTYMQEIIIGVVIIIAVALDRLRQRSKV